MFGHGIVFYLIVLAHTLASLAEHSAIDEKFAVVGYLPEWRYQGITDWSGMTRHLTHVILFSLEVSSGGEIEALDRMPSDALVNTIRKAATETHTKILVCFGGNARTNGFPDMVHSQQTRTLFVENVNKFIDKYHLDGVDLNWEYPSTPE